MEKARPNLQAMFSPTRWFFCIRVPRLWRRTKQHTSSLHINICRLPGSELQRKAQHRLFTDQRATAIAVSSRAQRCAGMQGRRRRAPRFRERRAARLVEAGEGAVFEEEDAEGGSAQHLLLGCGKGTLEKVHFESASKAYSKRHTSKVRQRHTSKWSGRDRGRELGGQGRGGAEGRGGGGEEGGRNRERNRARQRKAK
eukprot:6177931-Pleurochrysis_carterae.AAC.1